MIDVLPDLTARITGCLVAMGLPEVAQHLPELQFDSLCPCDDDSCASFYVAPVPPRTRAVTETETIPLLIDGDMVNLDVLDGQVCFVEVPDRPDLRVILHALDPPLSRIRTRA